MKRFFVSGIVIFLFVVQATVAEAQWVQVDGPSEDVVCFAGKGTEIFVGTLGNGVYLSSNAGSNWTLANKGLTDFDVHSLAVSGDNIFAGTDGGVFRSSDDGANWTVVNTGLTNTLIYALAVSSDGAGGSDLLAGTFGDGVFRSTDNGGNWSQLFTGLGNKSVECLAVAGNTIFVGTYLDGAWCSTDNGETFYNISSSGTYPDVYSMAVTISASSGISLFAGNENGVFLTTNSGSSWSNTGLSYVDPSHMHLVSPLVISGATLFAGTNGGGVFMSTTNAGSSWDSVGSGMTDGQITGLSAVGSNLFAGTLFNGLWRRPLSEFTYAWPSPPSLSGPANDSVWTGESVLLHWNSVACAMFFELEGAYDGDFVNVFLDTTGLADTSAQISFHESGAKYFWRVRAWNSAGTAGWSNILEFHTPMGVRPNSRTIAAYRLDQNCPNPFNPSTVIDYQLRENSLVTMKVYDVLGREVATLVSEHQIAGNHSVTFDARNLPSGMYLYRLQAGSYEQTKKLTVLK